MIGEEWAFLWCMMCDVFTQEAWTCLKAQFVCGRHALDTDMAGTWLLLCLQGVGRIFFFFLIYFWHGCDTVTKQQHQSWKIKIKGTVLLLPLIVHLDLRSPSLHLSFVACSLLISFVFSFFFFAFAFHSHWSSLMLLVVLNLTHMLAGWDGFCLLIFG